MKNLLFFLTAVIGFSLFTTSCNKESSISEDMEIIEQIVASENRTAIEISELPAITKTTVDEQYFETYIESAIAARGLGLEVELGNGEMIYFSERGEGLVSRRGFRHGHGPCGRGHRGTKVELADLPTTITDYITANYPDAETKRAKTNDNNGNYFVLIKTGDGRVVLKFDVDGNFIEEVSCIHHGCGGLTQVDVADLPTTITDYITANYPSADIQRAGQKTNSGNYGVVLNIDGDRVIVVFDEDGNFLFERS
ncbi:MAG: PepSY-like domain-containing protein [Saprospiraceae bacterium]